MPGSIEVSEQKISLEKEEPLKTELIDFLQAVVERRSPSVSGKDGLKAVKIVEAGLESMNSGSLIDI